jgi:hypothetical protein
MDEEEEDDDLLKRGSEAPEATNFGSLVSDSYGRLRYGLCSTMNPSHLPRKANILSDT